MAPEVLLRRKYDEKCDMWATGVILFVLLTGVPPFNGREDSVIAEQIKKGQYNKKSKPPCFLLVQFFFRSKYPRQLLTSLKSY